MSRTFTDVWKEAADLSDEDRATLAGLLIERIAALAEDERPELRMIFKREGLA